MRPLYIVFEGLPGSGKSEQLARLSRYMILDAEARGGPGGLIQAFEPSEGPVGDAMRGPLAEMYDEDNLRVWRLIVAADRTDQIDRALSRADERGYPFLVERQIRSSSAFLWSRYEGAPAIAVRPDLTLYLSVPVEVCAARLSQGLCSEGFLMGARYDDGVDGLFGVNLSQVQLTKNDGSILLKIDGNKPPDEVEADIRRVVEMITRERADR